MNTLQRLTIYALLGVPIVLYHLDHPEIVEETVAKLLSVCPACAEALVPAEQEVCPACEEEILKAHDDFKAGLADPDDEWTCPICLKGLPAPHCPECGLAWK